LVPEEAVLVPGEWLVPTAQASHPSCLATTTTSKVMAVVPQTQLLLAFTSALQSYPRRYSTHNCTARRAVTRITSFTTCITIITTTQLPQAVKTLWTTQTLVRGVDNVRQGSKLATGYWEVERPPQVPVWRP
jgi:hypothetical protein